MDAQLDVKTLKGLLRRRKKGFLIPFLLIFLLASVIAFVLPPIYKSESKILIEGQQIPEEYVKTTITSFVEERLQSIEQQIMSRNKLLDIINQFGLYQEMKDKRTTEEILAKMRKSIALKTISASIMNKRTGRANAATVAFTLSYEGEEPAKVQRVANALASLFLEEDLKRRTELATGTTDFLEQEAENIKDQIQLLENKIRAFKGEHIGELPEHNIVNLQGYERLERELDRIDTNINALEERRVYLQGQLAQVEPLTPVMIEGEKTMMNPKERLKRLRLELFSLQSTLSDKHPDIRKLKREISELEAQVGETDDSVEKVRRLSELTGELAALRGKLGPKHPDVVKLSREVDMLANEVETLHTERATRAFSEEKPDNPLYINLMTQIASAEMQLKGYRENRNRVEKELREYQRKIENAPLVEQEYIELTRGYESAKLKYNEITSKLLTARVASGMEQTQRGERFTVIDPAGLPEKPYKPNRLAIVLVGFVLALGAGAGLAAAGEAMDHSIKTADEINEITGAPVFSSVPLMESDIERRMRRIKRIILVLFVIVVIVVGLILVNRYVMPLEILWIKIQRKLTALGLSF